MVPHRYVDENGKDIKKNFEVDFIASMGHKKLYIPSALHIDREKKRAQEIASLTKINDSFKKIVVVKNNIKPWFDNLGIYYIGIRELLSGKHEDFAMV